MGRWGLILVTSLMAQIGYGQHEADVVMSIARWGSMSPLLVSPLAGPLRFPCCARRQARVPCSAAQHTTCAVLRIRARAAGGHTDADTHACIRRTFTASKRQCARSVRACVCVSAPRLHTARHTRRATCCPSLAHATHLPVSTRRLLTARGAGDWRRRTAKTR